MKIEKITRNGIRFQQVCRESEQTGNLMKAIESEAGFTYSMFTVIGDSMDNGTRRSFEDGDYVFVHPFSNNEFKANIREDLDSFWIIEYEGKTLFKQVIGFDESDGIKLHSLNETFEDIYLKTDDVSGFYRVIRKQGRQLVYNEV